MLNTELIFDSHMLRMFTCWQVFMERIMALALLNMWITHVTRSKKEFISIKVNNSLTWFWIFVKISTRVLDHMPLSNHWKCHGSSTFSFWFTLDIQKSIFFINQGPFLCTSVINVRQNTQVRKFTTIIHRKFYRSSTYSCVITRNTSQTRPFPIKWELCICWFKMNAHLNTHLHKINMLTSSHVKFQSASTYNLGDTHNQNQNFW